MRKKFLSLLLIACLWLIPTGILAENTYIVTLKDGCTMTEAQKDYYGLEQTTAIDHGFYCTDATGAKKAKSSTKTETVEKSDALSLCYTPNDTYYQNKSQWGVTAVNAEKAWDITKGSNTVNICVIDTGFEFTHADKSSNIIAGKDYLSTNKGLSTKDYGFHGTGTAGLIGAATNNNLGIAGLCDQCKIYILTAFSNDEGDDYTVASAIYDAIDIYDADVISMSFGGVTVAKVFEKAINYAYNHGAILVASSGNDGSETGSKKNQLLYPAAYSNVIGVGAVNSSLQYASFSTANSSVYVCAPGANIISLVPQSQSTSGYSNLNGTSFAAPFVAALAGMARSLDPDITQAEFCKYLKDTATDLGTAGYDIYTGYGLVNFEKLLSTLKTDLEEEAKQQQQQQQQEQQQDQQQEQQQQEQQQQEQQQQEQQQQEQKKQDEQESQSDPTSSVSFTDVVSGQWYYTAVTNLANDGIISGYTDGTFKPNNQITRAEVVKIMANTAHAIITNTQKVSFVDVPATAWYYKELSWAVNNGLVYGKDAAHFAPNDYITREELSCILIRYLNNIVFCPVTSTASITFKDKTNISSWAFDSVTKLTSVKIINGYTDGTFRPKSTATRAEVATMICSTRNYIKSN